MGRDHHRERALCGLRALGAGDQQQVVGDRPERDQVLLAGDVVGIALAHHAGAQVGPGAGGRLGQRERDLDLSGDERVYEALALLGRGVGHDRPPDPVDVAKARAYYLEALLGDVTFQLFGSAEEATLEQSIYDGVVAGRIKDTTDFDALTLSSGANTKSGLPPSRSSPTPGFRKG